MKMLLLGSNSQLAKELERKLSRVGNIAAFPRSSLDISDQRAVKHAVCSEHPSIIVNTAAYTAFDKAEDGKGQAHGASKLAGEQAIGQSNCQHLSFRTTWVIGKDANNFAKSILRLAIRRKSLTVFSGQHGGPTSPLLIAKVTIDAIQAIKNTRAWPQGIYHFVLQRSSNWHEIAQTLVGFAEKLGLALNTYAADRKAITTADYSAAAQRSLNSQRDTHKLYALLSFDLPHWKDDFLATIIDIIEKRQAS